MMLSNLIGTSEREAALPVPGRLLLTAARTAAVLGATLIASGALVLALVPLLTQEVSGNDMVGGSGIVLGGALWVVAQGLVARWPFDRDPQSVLDAAGWGSLAVVAAALGTGMVVGFSEAGTLAVVAVLVGLAELALVKHVDPEWEKRGPRGADSNALVSTREAEALVHRTAQVAVALGLVVGAVAAHSLVVHAMDIHEGFNLIGVWVAGAVLLGVGMWTLPHVAVLLGTGGGRVTWGGALLIAVEAAILIAAMYVLQWWAFVPVLAGLIVVLEVVLGVKLWSERDSVSR